jgi:hypothetical protein
MSGGPIRSLVSVGYALQSFLSHGGMHFESTQAFMGNVRRSTTRAFRFIFFSRITWQTSFTTSSM